jgi:signal transduction histidine kinase
MTLLLIKAGAIMAAAEFAAMCIIGCGGLSGLPFIPLVDTGIMLLLAAGPLFLLLRGENRKLEKHEKLDKKLHLILNDLWSASLHTLSTEELLGKILSAILENSPISLQRKGAIFLTEDGVLRLKSSFGFGDEQKRLCGEIPRGKCLCGAVLETGAAVYASAVDSRHHIRPGEIKPHGHYCLPIKSAGQVIGALNLYLDPGHNRDAAEEAFLGAVCAIIARIIEGKKLERSLFQMQKMEALNRFAAGIAHDFNNILGAIGGYSSAAARSLPPEAAITEDLREISAAVEKGTALTRQLKLFSRQSEETQEPVDLNTHIQNSAKMLRQLTGSGVNLELIPADRELPVICNRSHIDQLLMNLTVNAKDAMPGGGTLRLEVSEEEICFISSHQCLKAARLTVSDTGEGMDESLREKIFEPFFTTKPEGKGSGLGLSIVHGIVHQHGGEILVQSAPGAGTRFDIYLPLKANAKLE